MPLHCLQPARRRAARWLGGFSLLGLTGCSATGALNALVPRSTYVPQDDVAYGPDPRQRLDVYRPAEGAANAPLVVFFYGGNWTRGERADYRFVGEALASRGMVAVVADYRLSPQVGYADILRDCAGALAWAWKEAPALGADRKRLFVMGHSAGAYNAAMLALDERWLKPHRLAPHDLAGWIGLAGPYDFLPPGDPEVQAAFGWPRTPRDSQPVQQAAAGAPPALLLAAINDRLVDPQRNTVALARRLRTAGVPVEQELFDRVNHATLVGSLAAPLRWLAPVLDRVSGFVAR